MQYKIIVDKQNRLNPSEEKKEYIINIEELRAKGNVYDSLVITKDEDYVMRRLSLSEYGVLSVLEQEIKEPLEDINIELFEGDNYIYLVDMTGNKFYAEYIVKNDFTDTFVTSNEMNSTINQTAQSIELTVNQKLENYSTTEEMNSEIYQTAQSIMLQVNQKVDEDEFGTQLILNSEALKMAWNQISEYLQLEGIEGKASLVIYDENDKKLIVYDSTGQHFYDGSDNIFGEIGVKTVDNHKYVAFSVPGTYGQTIQNGMAWGITTQSDGKFYPILFIKNFQVANQSAGNFGGQLVLNYCDLLLNSGGIVSGNVRMFVDDVANGLVFEDTTTGDILFSIYPNSDLGYEQIGILNNVISFFKNQAGTHSFKIGTNKYLLFTDDGSLDVEDANILITASAFSLHLDSTAHIYGNVDIDGNIYADNISSDKRIKKNIKNSNIKALDLIKQIKHRQFEMKKDGTHYDIGYVAQELEKIDKNFVLIRKKDNKENERYYINELPILATATKAIQEQQDLIEKLQENDRKKDKLITDLANKIEQLEKEVQR